MKMFLGRFLCLISDFFHRQAGEAAYSGEETIVRERVVHAPDGKHRVCFFRRVEDGVCGFREEVYDDKAAEPHWELKDNGMMQEYKDMEAAQAAARAEVLWLNLVSD